MRKKASTVELQGSCECLSIALETAVYAWGETLESFFNKFEGSGLMTDFEDHRAFVTVGCRGEELVAKVYNFIELHKTGKWPRPQYLSRECVEMYTVEYWIGWTLAFVQYLSGLRFSQIFQMVPIEQWRGFYPMYHELGEVSAYNHIMQFIDGSEYVEPEWYGGIE
jgi:hypothetical protein